MYGFWMYIDFLSPDVMHGVGNLLTHLTIIGYKVSYQQVRFSFLHHFVDPIFIRGFIVYNIWCLCLHLVESACEVCVQSE